MIDRNPVFFLKEIIICWNLYFILRHHTRFEEVLYDLEAQVKAPDFPQEDNIKTLSFLYIYTNKFNLKFLIGDFNVDDGLIQEINQRIRNME